MHMEISKLMHTQSTYPYASVIASESGWTWRSSTYLCTYGKKLYMGIGMVKMRTIELGRKSALWKKVISGGKT